MGYKKASLSLTNPISIRGKTTWQHHHQLWEKRMVGSIWSTPCARKDLKKPSSLKMKSQKSDLNGHGMCSCMCQQKWIVWNHRVEYVDCVNGIICTNQIRFQTQNLAMNSPLPQNVSMLLLLHNLTKPRHLEFYSHIQHHGKYIHRKYIHNRNFIQFPMP